MVLSPSLSRRLRRSFRGDAAIDSMVVDLAYGDPTVAPSARFAAIYRTGPGTFAVLGTFADADVANVAVLNRKAVAR